MEREKEREREDKRRGGEIGERGWKDEEVTGVDGTNLSGRNFSAGRPVKIPVYIFSRIKDRV